MLRLGADEISDAVFVMHVIGVIAAIVTALRLGMGVFISDRAGIAVAAAAVGMLIADRAGIAVTASAVLMLITDRADFMVAASAVLVLITDCTDFVVAASAMSVLLKTAVPFSDRTPIPLITALFRTIICSVDFYDLILITRCFVLSIGPTALPNGLISG